STPPPATSRSGRSPAAPTPAPTPWPPTTATGSGSSRRARTRTASSASTRPPRRSSRDRRPRAAAAPCATWSTTRPAGRSGSAPTPTPSAVRRSADGRARAGLLVGLPVAVLGVAFAAMTPTSYPDRPAPGHTGGFGEPTCLACHFDGDLGPPGGVLEVEGWPEVPEPGAAYELAVR